MLPDAVDQMIFSLLRVKEFIMSYIIRAMFEFKIITSRFLI